MAQLETLKANPGAHLVCYLLLRDHFSLWSHVQCRENCKKQFMKTIYEKHIFYLAFVVVLSRRVNLFHLG